MKTPTIQDLYNETATIEVKFKEKPTTYGVDMIDQISKYGNTLRPDCKIHNFGQNQWFRTNMGMSNVNKYKSVKGLKQGITTASKKRGLTVEKIILKFK